MAADGSRGGKWLPISLLLLSLIIVSAKDIDKRVSPFCLSGTSPGFFVVDNTALVTSDSLEYKDFSEEDCQRTCITNLDPNGKTALCSSLTYDHVSFTCTIYHVKGGPQGDVAMAPAVGKRYFEKFCLPSDVTASSCAGAQFIRADDSVLIGYASNVSLVSTLEECVAYCVRDNECMSAMFFYEEGECITNTESALTQPAAFEHEESEKVVYFQNGCRAKQAVIDAERAASSTTKARKTTVKNTTTTKVATTSTSAPTTTSETTTTPAATTSPVKEEEYEEEEGEEESEEEVEEATTATTTTTKVPKKMKKRLGHRVHAEEFAKHKKHPKNFAAKTLHYKQNKIIKPDISKIDQIDAAQGDEVEEEEGKGEVAEAPSMPAERQPLSTTNRDPYTAFFSDWSAWTPCKRSGERRIRRRKCLDLRRCLGALMQVENCPALMPTLIGSDGQADESGALESVRSVIGAPLEGDSLAGLNTETTTVSLVGANIGDVNAPAGDGFIWSPWLGACQKFASGQPCNDGAMIGFESRECISKDPAKCAGPFFRYCTLPC